MLRKVCLCCICLVALFDLSLFGLVRVLHTQPSTAPSYRTTIQLLNGRARVEPLEHKSTPTVQTSIAHTATPAQVPTKQKLKQAIHLNPTPTKSPMRVNWSASQFYNCTNLGQNYRCFVDIKESPSSNAPIHFTVRDQSAIYPNGTLNPNQTVQIVLEPPSTKSDVFTIEGDNGASPITLSWTP